jgi:hypothetical protein
MEEKLINFGLEQLNRSVIQDTTKQSIAPVLQKNINPDTLLFNPVVRKVFNEKAVDSIFKIHDEREKQYQQEIALIQSKKAQQKIDTFNLHYKNLGFYNNGLSERLLEDRFQQNFLFNLPIIKQEEKAKNSEVFVYAEVKENRSTAIEKQIYIKSQADYKVVFDWISIIIFVSIVLLGWIRLFFNKYFLMVIKSTSSYHESNALFREKNTVVERVFFLLSILFLFTASIFALQLAHFYGIDFGKYKHSLFFLIIFVSLGGVYLFRFVFSSIIGNLFLKQKVFSEYLHNVNIYTMNTGIFLLPIIIFLQYLSFEYLKIIVYLGIVGIIFLYLVQLIRSFQIINRKNVSIFYMILYLCAFEFAPFLIVYKLLLSLN